MPISEKMVELNVISELSYWAIESGYRPLIIGFTQRQEALHGIDSAFLSSQAMFFQFKKADKRKKFYSYCINNNRPKFDQHEMFWHHTGPFGYYALPLFHTWSDVIMSQNLLLLDTEFVPVNDIGELPRGGKTHRIRIYDDNTMYVRSEPKFIGKRKPFITKEDLVQINKGENPRFLFDRMNLPPIKLYLEKHKKDDDKFGLSIEMCGKRMSGCDNKTYCIILREGKK